MYLPEKLRGTLSIFGEKGTVRIGGVALNKVLDWKFADGLDDEEQVKQLVNYEDPESVYGYGHTPLYSDFINAVFEDKEPTSILKMVKRQWKSCLASINPESLELQLSFP